MKNTKIVLGSIIWLALMACSKDDGPSNSDPIIIENKAPGNFELIGVTNGATKVDVFPTFSWKPSADPDGDNVTYDLLFDTEPVPATVRASNLTSSTFKVTERLHLTTPYYWKVVAKDGKGNSTASGTNNFTTRTLNFPMAPVTAAAFPKGISGHASAVFQNKLWVIGGQAGSEFLNTVWFSEDGSNWLLAPLPIFDKPFTPRSGHTLVVFDNKLWVIGGWVEGYELKNDVWYSYDGSVWTRATAAAAFSPRTHHNTAVFDDKLWVLGGNTAGGRVNDVWYSSDGTVWDQATGAAGFSGRDGHSTAVYDDKLWVIGGLDATKRKNDVWYSADGATWAQATEAAAFSGRELQTSAVYDEKLWIIGGLDGQHKNDVWYSSDGVTWSQATAAASFSARYNHTTVVFDTKVWLIGGLDVGIQFKNDVWAFD